MTDERATVTDLATRLALVLAAVALVIFTDAPAEPAWLLLGALVPTPRLGAAAATSTQPERT